MANPGGGVRKAAAAAESNVPENAGKWKRPGLEIRKALEVEERKLQERSTGRDQQRHTWALGDVEMMLEEWEGTSQSQAVSAQGV